MEITIGILLMGIIFMLMLLPTLISKIVRYQIKKVIYELKQSQQVSIYEMKSKYDNCETRSKL